MYFVCTNQTSFDVLILIKILIWIPPFSSKPACTLGARNINIIVRWLNFTPPLSPAHSLTIWFRDTLLSYLAHIHRMICVFVLGNLFHFFFLLNHQHLYEMLNKAERKKKALMFDRSFKQFCVEGNTIRVCVVVSFVFFFFFVYESVAWHWSVWEFRIAHSTIVSTQ